MDLSIIKQIVKTILFKNGINFSNTINDFSNQTSGSFNNVTLLNSQDTSNTDISYTITYTIYDNANKSSTSIAEG